MRAVLGSPGASLVLERQSDESVRVEVATDDGLRAETVLRELLDPQQGTLSTFLDSLAQDWRGWQGIRQWRSLEDELVVRASHDGHVRFEVELQASVYAAWLATCVITLEPGEQLTAAASAVRRLA